MFFINIIVDINNDIITIELIILIFKLIKTFVFNNNVTNIIIANFIKNCKKDYKSNNNIITIVKNLYKYNIKLITIDIKLLKYFVIILIIINLSAIRLIISSIIIIKRS